jgi:membrane peptidoglycan carboxypeptidase
MQMVSAVNVIAAGGELLAPRLVRAIVEEGRRSVQPTRAVERVLSRQTAAQLTSIMEAVVEEGTGRAARLPGYTIAGKTGTAAKLEHGHYSKTNYFASFVGFVPSRRPAATILVVIDSPHAGSYFGGTVAAPIFRRVAEATLRHLGVRQNVDPTAGLVVVHREPTEASDVVTAQARADLSRTPAAPLQAGIMPDLRGLSAREAVRQLSRLGVFARLVGDGLVADQELAPGAPLERGGFCVLHLSRAEPASPDTQTLQ